MTKLTKQQFIKEMGINTENLVKISQLTRKTILVEWNDLVQTFNVNKPIKLIS